MAVHQRLHAMTGDLLNGADPPLFQRLTVSIFQALTDGVMRSTLRIGRQTQQHLFIHPRRRVHAGHLEHPFGQGAGFVTYNIFGVCQSFQIVGAFHQNPVFRSATDTAEETQRNRDHQRAGAADDQKGQCSCDPLGPHSRMTCQQADQRRQHCQRQCAVTHGRGIVPGELGDKVLGLGLFHGRILHQIQDFRHGRLAEWLGGAHRNAPAHIDAATNHIVSRLGIPRHALAGKRTGIQRCIALYDHTVNGHLFAGIHHNLRAHFHVVRIHLFQFAVHHQIGIVRTNIHQGGNVLTALAHCHTLEQLADLVKQHNGHALFELL